MKIYRFLLILLAIFTFGFASISQVHAGGDKECTFTRDLTVGAVNDPATNDLVNLQNFLMRAGFLTSAGGDIFGPTLRTALASYQVARGISPSNGYFGPITRPRVATECLANMSSTGATYRLVTSTSGSGFGTVTGGGVYNEGALVTLEATPATGSVFSGWNNGRASGKSFRYPFVITEDQVANAIFDRIETATTSGRRSRPAIITGSNATTTALYRFTTYLKNAPDSVSSSGSISGTQTATKTTAGNTSVTGTYPAGTLMTLTATPDLGSMFLTWFGVGPCQGGNPICTFVLNQDNMSTEAVFKSTDGPGNFSFTKTVVTQDLAANRPAIVNPNGGSVTGTIAGSYLVGTVVNMTAIPASGYVFAGWSNYGVDGYYTLNGNGSGGKCHNQMGTSCSFVLDQDVAIYARFVPNTGTGNNDNNIVTTKSLTYTAGLNGSITGSLSQTVNSGSNGTPVTAVANSGYRFVNWSDGSTSNPRTDSSVTSNIAVTANFAANDVNPGGNTGVTYNLDLTKAGKAAAYGTVTSMGVNAEGRTSYAAGTRVTLTVTIADPTIAKFAGWNDGNVCSGRSMTCTFTITGNETAKANFDFVDPTRTSMFSSPSAIYSAIKSALNLQKGSVQSGVAALQRYLNTKGYIVNDTPGAAGSPGNESTYFGEKTEQAVVKFQQDNGLPATGVVGAQTKEVMKTK